MGSNPFKYVKMFYDHKNQFSQTLEFLWNLSHEKIKNAYISVL